MTNEIKKVKFVKVNKELLSDVIFHLELDCQIKTPSIVCDGKKINCEKTCHFHSIINQLEEALKQ